FSAGFATIVPPQGLRCEASHAHDLMMGQLWSWTLMMNRFELNVALKSFPPSASPEGIILRGAVSHVGLGMTDFQVRRKPKL
ncbi:MAG: hypothetical protein AAF539_11575, partial [Planctomycetota bacterium]